MVFLLLLLCFVLVGEKRDSLANATVAEPPSADCNSSSGSNNSSSSQGRTPRHSLNSNDAEQDARHTRPSSL